MNRQFLKTISIFVAFFFGISLLLPPEGFAESSCWNDGTITDGEGGTGGPTGVTAGNVNLKNNTEVADPVDVANGNYSHKEQDMFIPSRGLSLELMRFYNSLDGYEGPFGIGWSHSYNIFLIEVSDGTEDHILRRNANGSKDKFIENPDGTYTSTAGCYDTLTKEPTGYVIRDKHGLTHNFNLDGKLISIVDRNQNTITLEYDSQTGVLNKVSDSLNRYIEFTYSPKRKVIQLRDFTGRAINYTYDAEDNLIYVTTPATQAYPSGLTTKYEYDEDHNLTRITDPKGNTYLINHYNADDKIESQQYGYGTFYFSYDKINNITTMTDRKGYKKSWQLYENGTPYMKKECTVGLRDDDPPYHYFATFYEYNENRELTSVYRSPSKVEYTYDDRGNILEVKRTRIPIPDPIPAADKIITTFTYEPNFNQIKTITDPRGNVTTYDYDSRGNLIRITYPTAAGFTPQIIFTYNGYGQVETATDPNGNITKYEYYLDTGYLKKIIAGFGSLYQAETELTYDATGNLTSITDPKGNTTSFIYNLLNQVVQVTSPAPFNYITDYSYDRNGNLERVSKETGDPSNVWQTTTYSYDILDRLETITDDLGNTTTFSYDLNGNRSLIQDAEGNTTTYQYDERDLLWKVTDALGNTTEYAYYHNANLKRIKDANSNITSYSYDIFGRLTTTTYPDSSTEDYTYDKASNLTQKINRRNDVITYSYDELNRLIQKSTPENTINYSYDAGSRLSSVTDLSGTINYTYDALSRVIQVTYPGTNQLHYEYDTSGNRTKLTYSDSTYISYEYDELNRLTNIKDQATNTIASYSYDGLSRRTQLDYANSTQTTYDYDAINRLTALTNTYNPTPSTYSYSYDNVGNRLTKTDTTGTETYTYDNIYQLTNVTYPDTSTKSYNYDSLGNRTSTVNGGTTTYVPNNMNQYTSVGGTTYTYDSNGNLTNDGTSSYTYDSENRLISATTPSHTATYTYDPFGRRTQKDVDGTITNYIYDGDQVICETDAAGIITAKYIYGPGIDEPISMQRGGQTYYYHFDGLGSVTALTDSNGETVETYTYDVYGQPNTTSSISNPYMFTARRLDPETYLYYYRERYYSPLIGRFLQTDPLEIDDENKYAYCYNDPVNYIDPYGFTSVYYPGPVVEPPIAELIQRYIAVDISVIWEPTGGIIEIPGITKPGGIAIPSPGTKTEIKEKLKKKLKEKEKTLVGGIFNKAKGKAEGKEEKPGLWRRFKKWWKKNLSFQRHPPHKRGPHRDWHWQLNLPWRKFRHKFGDPWWKWNY